VKLKRNKERSKLKIEIAELTGEAVDKPAIRQNMMNYGEGRRN
jgi:hypothetical protein